MKTEFNSSKGWKIKQAPPVTKSGKMDPPKGSLAYTAMQMALASNKEKVKAMDEIARRKNSAANQAKSLSERIEESVNRSKKLLNKSK